MRKFGFVLSTPGNYPRDLCEIIENCDQQQLVRNLELRPVNGVVLIMNLRNFGEVIDFGRPARLSRLLTELFDQVAVTVHRLDGSYVNKLLGDGLLAYFGEKQEPHKIYNAVQELRDFFARNNQKFATDVPKTHLLGMTCVLLREPCWIGAIGGGAGEYGEYQDYTLLSSNLFKAFRLLEWINADTVMVSEQLKPEFAFDFVTVQVFPSPQNPPFYSIAREKTLEEKGQDVLFECDNQCDWYETCFWAHEQGSKRLLIDCHQCHEYFVGQRSHPKDYCWNWGGCLDKLERQEYFRQSPCCSACERHRACFHSYCRGRGSTSMLRCQRAIGSRLGK